MDQINEFTVPEELEDERFDAVVASLSEGQSRSYLTGQLSPVQK